MNLSAVILAGGQSRRMGRDKAWLEWEGQPLIARAVSVVRAAGFEEILISGRPGIDYSAMDCPVLLDLEPGLGPLAGISRALETTAAPLSLVLAVDLPLMTAAFLRKLAHHCGPRTGAIPKLNGRLEPLAAIYPRRCRFTARQCLMKSQLAARDFADACLRDQAIRFVPVEAADARCFANWNCPADVPDSTLLSDPWSAQEARANACVVG